MSKKLYALADDDQARTFLEKAWYWFSDRDGEVMFEDCGTTVRTAVAEYIANQEGLTLYACKATDGN